MGQPGAFAPPMAHPTTSMILWRAFSTTDSSKRSKEVSTTFLAISAVMLMLSLFQRSLSGILFPCARPGIAQSRTRVCSPMCGFTTGNRSKKCASESGPAWNPCIRQRHAWTLRDHRKSLSARCRCPSLPSCSDHISLIMMKYRYSTLSDIDMNL